MEVIVEFTLIHELWMFGAGGFKFDGDFEIGFGVDALVNLSEGSLVKLTDDLVVFADLLRNLRHSIINII